MLAQRRALNDHLYCEVQIDNVYSLLWLFRSYQSSVIICKKHYRRHSLFRNSNNLTNKPSWKNDWDVALDRNRVSLHSFHLMGLSFVAHQPWKRSRHCSWDGSQSFSQPLGSPIEGFADVSLLHEVVPEAKTTRYQALYWEIPQCI